MSSIGTAISAFGAHALQNVSMSLADMARGVGYACLLFGVYLVQSAWSARSVDIPFRITVMNAVLLGLALMAALGGPGYDGKRWALTALAYLLPALILPIGLRTQLSESSNSRIGYGLIEFGTVVFSLSLAIMSFTSLRWLGAITPIGGAALIAGWASLAYGSMKDPLWAD